MRNLIFLSICLLTPLVFYGQFNIGFGYHLSSPVAVAPGDTLLNPWAGGMNTPQISSIDLNLDDDLDLFVYERDGELRKTFVYNEDGTYSWQPQYINKLPKLSGSYALMRDYDGDGRQDIYTAAFNNYGLDVYRNTSDTSLKFEKTGDALTYSREGGSALFFYVAPNDLPAIDDFDGDGDLDFLFQGQVNLTPYVLLFIKNLSMEKYGTSDSLSYRLVNKCWGKVRENSGQSGWTEFQCDTSGIAGRDQRHGGTTLTPIDLNNDNKMDLITGDSYSGRLMTMMNVADNVYGVVDLSQSDSTFPSTDVPADVANLPGVYLEDVDHDGVKDMMVTPNQLNISNSLTIDTSVNTLVDWYYRNEGTNANPDFKLEKQGLLSSEMIDVGFRSLPVVADLNADGLNDIVIGNAGYNIYGGSASASIQVYFNIGDSANPAFELYEDDLADISTMDFGIAHPAFADLDDDGDMDMIVGDDQGRLHYFKNKGVPTVYDFHLTAPQLEGIDVGVNAHPQFFDLNSDGKEDLIVGDYYGRIHYHENKGTATVYDYTSTPTIEDFGGLLLFHTYGGATVPHFTRKLDSNNSTIHAMVSTGDGPILVYGPILDLEAEFELADSIIVEASYTAIAGGNLLGDYRDEFIVGQQTGGLFFLERLSEIGVGIENWSNQQLPIQVYPNPSKGIFTVQLDDLHNQTAFVEVVDISGKVITGFDTRSTNDVLSFEVDLTNHPSGCYFLSIKQNQSVHWTKIIKY